MKTFAAFAALACGGAFAWADGPVASATGPAGGNVIRPSMDVIWDQSWDGVTTAGNAAQDFEAAFDAYDIFAVMDFNTASDYFVEKVSSAGFNSATGNSALTTDVLASVWDAEPWNGGSVLFSSVPATGVDTLGTDGMISTTFGGDLLPAGNYFLSLAIDRDFGTGGQGFLYQTTNGNGVPDNQYNPGGGFGLPNGTWGPTAQELNFVLEGTLVPEPASLGLLALVGLLGFRRR